MAPPPPAPNAPQLLEKDIRDWIRLSNELSDLKAKEAALRKSIADRVFATNKQPNGAWPEGTTKGTAETTSATFKGSLKQHFKREVLIEAKAGVLEELAELDEAPDDLVIIDLFKQKWELSKSTYNKLSDAQKAIVDKALVISPAHIELDLVELPK